MLKLHSRDDRPMMANSVGQSRCDSHDAPLIDVRDVSKKFCRNLARGLRYGITDILRRLAFRDVDQQELRADEFWALNRVTFQMRRGESVGVIGRNGAGKSTLLKMLIGRLLPTGGRIETRGRIVAITELGLGFDPVLTGRENIFVNAAVFGMSRAETGRIVDKVAAFAGLDEFLDAPVQTYSSGMKARLGYSVAAHMQPDILLIDEVLAVGDFDFRRKCLAHIRSYLNTGGSLILVSHEQYAVQNTCSRCLVLDHGRVLFDGPTTEAVNLHFELGRQQELEQVRNRSRAEGQPGNSRPEDRLPVGSAKSTHIAGPSPTSGESNPHDSSTSRPHELIDDSPSDAFQSPVRQGPMDSALPAVKSPLAVPNRESARRRMSPDQDHPVVIRSVSLRGTEADRLEMNQSARLTIDYRSAVSLENALWGFVIYSADLTVPITSGVADVHNRQHPLIVGDGKLTCVMRGLPLRPGNYAIRIGIADAATGALLDRLGWDDEPHFFSVHASASPMNNIHSTIRDLVSINVQWE